MDSFQNDVRSPSTESLRRLRGKAISFGVAAAVGLFAFQSAAIAADATAAANAGLEEVIITGSSIAQRADTSSLPVTILTAKDIAKTGLTSASDLIQNLPSMQGFVPSSSSVNGGGGGATSAAVHALPSKYTVVLIDGERVQSFGVGTVQGGGSAVNLESIPLDAVERVEVLTDGASALYGADAIAGVVNFIMKKNRTDGSAYYNTSIPDQAGGGGWSAGISKGFGDLKSDGYNLLLTYSHDVQDKLQASERAASTRGGYFPFSSGGTDYIYNVRTSNTEPANISLAVATAAAPNTRINVSFNPYYTANGNCGTPFAGVLVSSPLATTCRFNFAATVQDIPSYVRDSGMLKGTFNVGNNSELWAEAMVSRFDMVAQFAPPAQPLGVRPASATSAGRLNAIWQAYVVPYLAANNYIPYVSATRAAQATLGYRAVSAGGRTDDFGTQFRHIAIGFDTKIEDWTIKASFVASHGKLTDTAAGGYLSFDQFSTAVSTGAYDPVLATGQSSIKAAILNKPFSFTNSDLHSLEINAQHKVFDLDGGASILSIGGELASARTKTNYSDLVLSGNGTTTQPLTTDSPVGGSAGLIDSEGDRTNWGLFGEWLLPFRNDLSVTSSIRYDSYAKTHSTTVFSLTPDAVTGLYNQLPNADEGSAFSKATYKLSFRYTPIEKLVLRGSIGTGFKAPEISDISTPLAFGGSTSGTYGCPIPTSANCIPGSAQYDLITGGNPKPVEAGGLKPETSTQFTFGVRVDPVPSLSLGLDYWNVRLKDQILSAGIAEQVAFANPSQYQNLFVDPFFDPTGGFNTIGYLQTPFNGPAANYSGLDWNFSYRTDTAWGKFSANWTGTQTLTQNYQNFAGGPKLTDLSVYGPDQAVVFRTISQLALSLQTDKWLNTLSIRYKSGYTDAPHIGDGTVFLAGPNGTLGARTNFCCLSVSAYTTLDWQTSYDIAKAVNLTFGVKNLSNKAPPLSLQSGGGGNQSGYDGRYYDPIGRAYYLRANYKF